MIDKPKITVFMAAYNASAYIEDSIASILNQTFGDFELLIVNDGSTDHSVEIIESFTDKRIRLIHNGENRGLVFTRNQLLKEARGTYIAILDSDDISFPDRLQFQYDFMTGHPQIALCGGHALLIDEHGVGLDDKFIVPFHEQLNMVLLFQNPFINSATIFKSAVLKELNGYREYAPAEDFELFFRISEKYQIANIDKVLIKYRIHHSNTSSVQAEKLHESELKIITDMQRSLGMPYDEHLLLIHFSIFSRQFQQHSFSAYLSLFKAMKAANRSSNRFPEDSFDAFLFNKWYELIRHRERNKNALFLLFNRTMFKWSYVTPKQIRKVFKQSLSALIK